MNTYLSCATGLFVFKGNWLLHLQRYMKP